MDTHETTAETPVCKRLRTKMYYVMGREHVDLRVSGPTAQYWCSRTATVMGPDDVCCSPEALDPAAGLLGPCLFGRLCQRSRGFRRTDRDRKSVV